MKKVQTLSLHIENMTCGGCVRGVTSAIQKLDADASVDASPPTRSATITTRATTEEVLDALAEAGFLAQVSTSRE